MTHGSKGMNPIEVHLWWVWSDENSDGDENNDGEERNDAMSDGDKKIDHANSVREDPY